MHVHIMFLLIHCRPILQAIKAKNAEHLHTHLSLVICIQLASSFCIYTCVFCARSSSFKQPNCSGNTCEIAVSASPERSEGALGCSMCRALGRSMCRALGRNNCRALGCSMCRALGRSICKALGQADLWSMACSHKHEQLLTFP